MITTSFRPKGARPGPTNAATRTWSGQVEILDSASFQSLKLDFQRAELFVLSGRFGVFHWWVVGW